MIDLLDMVTARVTQVTDAVEYDNPDGAGTLPVTVKKGFLNPAAAVDPFPFVLCRLKSGHETARAGEIVVRLWAGIHTNGDTDAGQADIAALLGRLLGILEQRSFPPYTMAPDAPWFYGDKDDAVQPHPKYYATVDLVFTRQATALNSR